MRNYSKLGGRKGLPGYRTPSPFRNKVLEVVRKIPKGKTLTYREVAQKAGSPGAWRAVGSIMKNNYDETVPCYRVIKSDGTLGEYNRGGCQQKRKKLLNEGAIKE